jgi:hypothetical protein
MTEVTRALNSYVGAGQHEQVCVPLHVLHAMLHSHLMSHLFVRISSTGCGSKLKCPPSALAGRSKRLGGPQPPMLASAAARSTLAGGSADGGSATRGRCATLQSSTFFVGMPSTIAAAQDVQDARHPDCASWCSL